MYWTNGWPAHLDWTAVSQSEQTVTTDLSSQARNWPPPQTHAICGLHSLGHQHASVRGAHRSLAAMHSQAPRLEHGVVVEPSPVLFRLPPQPSNAVASARTTTWWRAAFIARPERIRAAAAAGRRRAGRPRTATASQA